MPEQQGKYDLIIVGGGPAGSAAAIYACRAGLKTLLLEKETFPRDKICGDAISGKSMTILKELGLVEKAAQLPSAHVDSITFGSPDHVNVNIPLQGKSHLGMPTGLVVRRSVFDNFLFNEAQMAGAVTRQNFTVTDLVREDNQVIGVTGTDGAALQTMTFYSRLALGADGYHSIVARKTGLYQHDSQHWVVALRQYYRNVSGLNGQIELHYVDEVQPGYFWIFPADENRANIGIGMLHKTLKKRKLDLKKSLQQAIESPAFRERFAHAEPLEAPVGWNLPVGSKHRPNYGNGFLLLGDAAGLIDPFTGEGIGNALYSGRQAARVAKEAIAAGNFTAKFLKRYDERLWKEIGPELQISSRLQKIGQMRFLLSFVINKAARNEHVREIISGMIANQIPKTKFANPLFYLKLLLS
jgi:geranylgeranyl reductase family protein